MRLAKNRTLKPLRLQVDWLPERLTVPLISGPHPAQGMATACSSASWICGSE